MGTKNIEQFLTGDEVDHIRRFTSHKETPLLVIDLEKIAANYDELKRLMPTVHVYYAMKANPHKDVIQLLYARGSSFDVASRYEIDAVLAAGVSPDRVSYGNTIKKERDIAYAFQKGIRLFTTDSVSDIEKLSRNAPGAKVTFRILLDGAGADWPLSRKFGAHPDMLYRIILSARKLGLVPWGLSFHVGSQQRDIGQWDSAIALCKYLCDALKDEGIIIKAINLGGGFPAHYVKPTKDLSIYAQNISQYLKEDFGDRDLEIIIEPGRSLVADAGIIVSEVVMISTKSATNDTRWVYLDIGKFGGLIETMGESIKYPIFVEGQKEINGNSSEVILAGPTCDSADILYENYKYKLPNELKEGDRVYILSTGAYTMSYSSVSFNGFPPLQAEILPPRATKS